MWQPSLQELRGCGPGTATGGEASDAAALGIRTVSEVLDGGFRLEAEMPVYQLLLALRTTAKLSSC
jgi:hypothetical protein